MRYMAEFWYAEINNQEELQKAKSEQNFQG